ncbi:MAG: isochorismatase family protein [Actinobacteria bacterium]|nr:isochorismatase family protein [Actinomycetota bacterium]
MSGQEPSWYDILTTRDRQVFAASGYGSLSGLGVRPALLVVDVTYEFVGHTRKPILDAVRAWPNACGEDGWDAVEKIKILLATARITGTPVFYTRSFKKGPNTPSLGRWSDKNERTSEWDRESAEIVKEIAPLDGEVLFEKTAPSGFFGTGLPSTLVNAGIDTLLICGGTTSGCVRATVVDAFSYNYKVGVIEDAVFDRGESAHKASLADISFKYGDVINSEDARHYLSGLAERRASGEAG